MTAPTPQSYPVSKPLWDAMEAALMAKSRELIRDIAKTLKQDEKKLLTTFRANKKDIYLIDVSDPTEQRFQCEALVRTTAVAQRCRKPVQYGEKHCPIHNGWNMTESLRTKPTLRCIRSSDGDTYYLDVLTQQVYNQDYERIGYHTDGKVVIFEIEEV